MLSSTYLKAIKALHSRLEKANIEWYVTGKTNLALQGINIKPSHLGILIHEADLEKFLELFSEYKKSEIIELENGEAKEFTMSIDRVEVMVCAEYPHGTYWVVMNQPETVSINNIKIPCFSLKSEKEAYAKLRMEDKIKQINDYMANKRDKIINRILHGVDVPIFSTDGKVLMLKRDLRSEKYKTGWEYVKGGLKENETFVQAALREAKEEAGGLKLEILGEIEKVFKVDAQYRKKPDYDHIEKRAVVLLATGGKVSIDSKEHSEYKWMDYKQAHNSIWVEKGKEILKSARQLYDKWQKNQSIADEINSCRKCRLNKTRNLAVPGEGPKDAKIMFVGEAPGHVNDQEGRPFVGYGGRIFDGILTLAGIKRERIFITNAVKCWPPENRKPRIDELSICKQYLDSQIRLIQPKLIFALGATAFLQLTGMKIKMKEEHGNIFYRHNIPVCPIFHPNGIRYIKGGKQAIVKDIQNAISVTDLTFF